MNGPYHETSTDTAHESIVQTATEVRGLTSLSLMLLIRKLQGTWKKRSFSLKYGGNYAKRKGIRSPGNG